MLAAVMLGREIEDACGSNARSERLAHVSSSDARQRG